MGNPRLLAPRGVLFNIPFRGKFDRSCSKIDCGQCFGILQSGELFLLLFYPLIYKGSLFACTKAIHWIHSFGGIRISEVVSHEAHMVLTNVRFHSMPDTFLDPPGLCHKSSHVGKNIWCEYL